MGRERREFWRVTQAFDGQYRMVGELGASWSSALIVNLSAGGLRVRCAESIPSGSAIEIQVLLPTTKERFVINGRVIWEEMQASGVNEHGVEFADTTPEQQAQIDGLVQFLRKHSPPPPASS